MSPVASAAFAASMFASGFSPSMPIVVSRSLAEVLAAAAPAIVSIALRSSWARRDASTSAPASNSSRMSSGSVTPSCAAIDSTAVRWASTVRTSAMSRSASSNCHARSASRIERGSVQPSASASVRSYEARAAARASSSGASSGRMTHWRQRSVKSAPVSSSRMSSSARQSGADVIVSGSVAVAAAPAGATGWYAPTRSAARAHTARSVSSPVRSAIAVATASEAA